MNLLGDEVYMVQEEPGSLKEAKLYIYGKHEVKPGRKMGHITFMRKPDQHWIQQMTEKWTERDGGREQ